MYGRWKVICVGYKERTQEEKEEEEAEHGRCEKISWELMAENNWLVGWEWKKAIERFAGDPWEILAKNQN